MKLLRLLLRFHCILLHVLLGVILCVLVLHRGFKKTFRQKIVCWWLTIAGKIFGLQVRVIGNRPQAPVYLISNHISWLDIVVLGSIQPVSFLSKEEIKHWPVVGYMARKSGTVFIRRGSTSNNAKKVIAQHLLNGNNVVVFPEGTTSDGIKMRPFYPRLFAAAIDYRIPIQPIALVYPPTTPDAPNRTNPIVPLKNSAQFCAQCHCNHATTSHACGNLLHSTTRSTGYRARSENNLSSSL